MQKIMDPENLAIIGASKNPEKIGHLILKNILNFGFSKKIFPINPSADEILGLKT